ncbi:MAG: ATP synthase subunit I [Candidatus Aminicenantes bacterium]|nr:ATP synthase subunit I [Candidatus Aminicenantes bacterium]
MMTDIVKAIWFLFVGGALGFIYFGGLWWTVKKLPRSRRPHLLTLASLFVRSGFVLVGLFLVARGGRWESIVAALLGMIAVRWALIRRLSPAKEAKRACQEG